jgi:hypothetical protein
MICEAETVGAWFQPLPAPEIGSVVAYCSIELERDGRRDRTGHAALVVDLPDRWTITEAAWTAMRIIHCSPSIQRRRGYAIDETHAAAWAHRASFRGTSHPRWRTRFLRYLRTDSPWPSESSEAAQKSRAAVFDRHPGERPGGIARQDR